MFPPGHLILIVILNTSNLNTIIKYVSGYLGVNRDLNIPPSLGWHEVEVTLLRLSQGHCLTHWWRCQTERVVEVHRYGHNWYSAWICLDWSIWFSFQSDKKKKSFFQRHLPSGGDNERDSKSDSPLSSPQVLITTETVIQFKWCCRTAASWAWSSPPPDRHIGGWI